MEGTDYFIDWDTHILSFKDQDTFHTYSIIICVNVEYINNLVKTIYHLK